MSMLYLGGLIGLVGIAVAATATLVRRRKAARDPAIPLVFPPTRAPAGQASEEMSREPAAKRPAEMPGASAVRAPMEPAPTVEASPPPTPGRWIDRLAEKSQPGQSEEIGNPTIRLDRPAEVGGWSSVRTLQLLPGLLEVLEGTNSGPEFRFFRTTSAEGVEVTLGRSEGIPYRHLQIEAPSVSRTHARLRYHSGRWTIVNLSQTNPLRVNGRELGDSDHAHVLSDGDRVQMGEVVLRFRDLTSPVAADQPPPGTGPTPFRTRRSAAE